MTALGWLTGVAALLLVLVVVLAVWRVATTRERPRGLDIGPALRRPERTAPPCPTETACPRCARLRAEREEARAALELVARALARCRDRPRA